MPSEFGNAFKIGLLTGVGFRLFEDQDYSGADVYFVLRFTGAEFGNGKCACGRKLPRPELHADMDDDEAIELAHAILKNIAYRKGRAAEKAAFAGRIRRERQRLESGDTIESLRALESKILDY